MQQPQQLLSQEQEQQKQDLFLQQQQQQQSISNTNTDEQQEQEQQAQVGVGVGVGVGVNPLIFHSPDIKNNSINPRTRNTNSNEMTAGNYHFLDINNNIETSNSLSMDLGLGFENDIGGISQSGLGDGTGASRSEFENNSLDLDIGLIIDDNPNHSNNNNINNLNQGSNNFVNNQSIQSLPQNHLLMIQTQNSSSPSLGGITFTQTLSNNPCMNNANNNNNASSRSNSNKGRVSSMGIPTRARLISNESDNISKSGHYNINQHNAAMSRVYQQQPVQLEGLTSHVYCAVYSGVAVFEMLTNNVAVMRRQKDGFMNATQILKVANIDKGKRTKILEKEILNKEHEKVQGGYGKYQGTWIPFERGLELAKQFGVEGLLRPLFEYSLAMGREKPPTKDPSSRSSMRRIQPAAAYNHDKDYQPTGKRVKLEHSVENPDTTARDRAIYLGISFGEEFEAFNENQPPSQYVGKQADVPGNYTSKYFADPYGIQNQFNAADNSGMIAAAAENPYTPQSTAEPSRHRATIISLFLNSDAASLEFLACHSVFPADFDIDLILDDQGHTALFWAAALANVKLLTLLIEKGARIDALSYNGESALIRSVMMTHNYDHNTFLQVLSILKDVIHLKDKKMRTVLHHICNSVAINGQTMSARYYMQCVLHLFANNLFDENASSGMVHMDSQNLISTQFQALLNATDVCGDTALNIAARLGDRVLYEMLVEAGASDTIGNNATLRPVDYGIVGKEQDVGKKTIIYPSIRNDNENAFGNLDGGSNDQLSSQEALTLHRTLVQNENAEIPALRNRILILETALANKTETEGNVGTTDGIGEDISSLKIALSNYKVIVSHLCREIVAIRTSLTEKVVKAKGIIIGLSGASSKEVDAMLADFSEDKDKIDCSGPSTETETLSEERLGT